MEETLLSPHFRCSQGSSFTWFQNCPLVEETHDSVFSQTAFLESATNFILYSLFCLGCPLLRVFEPSWVFHFFFNSLFIFPLLPRLLPFWEFSNLTGWLQIHTDDESLSCRYLPFWLLTTRCFYHWLSGVDNTDIADYCNTCKSSCLTPHVPTLCHSRLSSRDYSFIIIRHATLCLLLISPLQVFWPTIFQLTWMEISKLGSWN